MVLQEEFVPLLVALSQSGTLKEPDKRKSLISSSINQREGSSPSYPHSLLDDSLHGVANNMLGLDVERILIKSSEERMGNSGEINSHSLVGHNRTTSASNTLSNSNFSPTILGNGNDVFSRPTKDVLESQHAAPLYVL
ncbi:hypothetical protein RDI58_010842 [Solanum bulbocastanum]|uniref:Uncharacterized protein n=1 Tax=Solanum bulbocastanum TaxID=147425 RepID=A0AAN8TUC2_SOLBU